MENKDNLSHESAPLMIDLKIEILYRWKIAIDTISLYEYYKYNGNDCYHNEVKRDVYRLFQVIRTAIKKDIEVENYNKINESFKRESCEYTLESFNIIDDWLYLKKLTRFDTRQIYDRTRAELTNKQKGF